MEKFSYEQNGYSRSDVNQFISEVIVETEKLISVVKKQKLEIEELKRELNHYKNSEGILNNLITTATEANKELKNFVQEEKEEILISAKNNASKIVNEALLEAKRQEERKNKLQEEINSLKRKLRNIIDEQEELISNIDWSIEKNEKYGIIYLRKRE